MTFKDILNLADEFGITTLPIISYNNGPYKLEEVEFEGNSFKFEFFHGKFISAQLPFTPNESHTAPSKLGAFTLLLVGSLGCASEFIHDWKESGIYPDIHVNLSDEERKAIAPYREMYVCHSNDCTTDEMSDFLYHALFQVHAY